jgi:hypothetical protein
MQGKLSAIFRIAIYQKVLGWVARRGTDQDYIERADPPTAWTRKRPLGRWKKVPDFRGNL